MDDMELASKISLEESIRAARAKLAFLQQEAFTATPGLNEEEVVASIFSAFAKEGMLDAAGMQEMLSVVAGQTSGDGAACVAALLGPAGGVTAALPAFQTWWRGAPAFAAFPLPLLRLHAKLHSRRTLSVLAPLLAGPPRLAPPAAPVLSASIADRCAAELNVEIGKFAEAASSAQLLLEKDPEGVRECERDLALPPGALIIEAVLLVKSGATGADREKLRTAFTRLVDLRLRRELKFTAYRLAERTLPDSRPVIVLQIGWHNRAPVDTLKEAIAALDVSRLQVQLELSQRPGQPCPGFLQARASLSLALSRIGLQHSLSQMVMTGSVSDVNVCLRCPACSFLTSDLVGEGL
jgi:hypothetical protein